MRNLREILESLNFINNEEKDIILIDGLNKKFSWTPQELILRLSKEDLEKEAMYIKEKGVGIKGTIHLLSIETGNFRNEPAFIVERS